MATVVYPKYLEALHAGGNIDLASADVRAILVDLADYTYNAAHDFLNDVPSAARVAVTASLTGKTLTNGTFDCADSLFPNVSGDPSEAIIFYIHDGGDDTARRLISFHDTGTGLPVTPNGATINLIINAAGVYSL